MAAGLCLFSLSILLYVLFFANPPGDTEYAARRTERQLSRRMEILDGYAAKALAQNPQKWMELKGLPSDMVLYRYVLDSLQSWANRFILANDDLTKKHMVPVLDGNRGGMESPLSEVTVQPTLVNLGHQWYLLKSYEAAPVKLIGGLLLMDDGDERSLNGASPYLHLADKFSIKPITFSGGTPVEVGGVPQFKILADVQESSQGYDTELIWVSLFLLAAAMFLILLEKRSFRRYVFSSAVLLAALVAMYISGMRAHARDVLFSPVLYADGTFLYSLGAVFLVNMAMQVLIANTFLIRRQIYSAILRSRHTKLISGIYGMALISVVLFVVLYAHDVFQSIIENSNICLELYKFKDLSQFTALVYLSFASLLALLAFLVQMLRPVVKLYFGKSFNALSISGRLLTAALTGVYFTLVPAVHGLKKEETMAAIWADRLSIDRDISLELLLRRVEDHIAEDVIISTLSFLENSNYTIMNRLSEAYLSRMTQNYDMSVYLFTNEEKDPAAVSFFNDMAQSGVQIGAGSRFRFFTTGSGYTRYAGVFSYVDHQYSVSHMVLSIEPRLNKNPQGYASVLNLSAPGQVVLPARYSYAKYSDSKLTTYRGAFAYPTVLGDGWKMKSDGLSQQRLVKDGYLHMLNRISEDELVIISHRTELWVNYVIAAFFVTVVIFLILTVVGIQHRKKSPLGRNYYRSRILYVLVVSLILTLVAMATLSVYFVYQRNNANKLTQMTERINAIQALLESECRLGRDYRDLNTQEFSAFLEGVSAMSKADITLYTPEGKAFKSTSPEVFERLLVSDRIDQDAYESIVFLNQRYHINQESISGNKFFSLYAPLFNSEGKMLAIIGSPFTDETYDFEMDAFLHSAAIITIFIILLLIARFSVSKIVDRMFKPLSEMGRKMSASDVRSLEYISYDRDDEMSGIVGSYNRMIRDLSESTRQLAQAERDKAWSLMARQVAHDIKNPLTPMKLQIQRVQRLKARGAEGWEEKFDDMSKLLLDHIELLSDTATEFSMLAKLDDEPMTTVNLDSMIREEISMFDNKENITFEYLGFEGAKAEAPRPQLMRVFVNLLVNSVQAIESVQQDAAAAGREPEHGRISVSLRNSSEDGFYDIVFEDNGPGVSEEHIPNLFTLNFTTKSSGSGLGLTISRTILEKCGAGISYSRSFSLGGACFTVRYPKS